MFRHLTEVLAVLLAGLVLALAAPGFSAGSPADGPAPPRPDYVPRPQGPLNVKGSPVAIGAPTNGSDYNDLEVLTRTSGLMQFQNLRYGRLEPSGTVPLPGVSSSLSFQDRFKETPYRVIARSDSGSISLVKKDEDSGKADLSEVLVGGNPSSATKMSMMFGPVFFLEEPGNYPWFAVTDQDAYTFSIYNPTGTNPGQAWWSIGVGSDPVAAATVNDFFWLVVNRGSDDISVVRLVIGDADPNGHLEAIGTIPVGESPVAITHLRDSPGRNLMAAVNKGSGSVSIIELFEAGTNLDAKVIQTIGVGEEPTSITPVDANGDKSYDLAVTNSGSDDVSILIDDGSGHFLHGQRVEVGHRPVAITSMNLDRYFRGDLAVVNAGSRNVSLLLRRNGAGTCYDRPAHTVEGTPGSDFLWGTRDPDLTNGYAGDDEIRGSTGYDCLYGGTGNDLIRAGFHNDRVFGGEGNDRLTAFVGNDVIRAGRGDDVICDSDQVFSRCFRDRNGTYRANVSDRDRVFGGRGDDRITAGPQRDMISGGPGDDVIDSQDGDRDQVRCGPGSDIARTDIKDQTSDCEVVQKREPH